MDNGLANLIVAAIVVIVGIAVLWFVFARLYQRSSTEVSFVRTGLLGRKVVISGGAFVIPVLHDAIRVNMNTVRLDVACTREKAVISQDRIRVDVEADFFVRVDAARDPVALAAQTLGSRTANPSAIKELIGGKFVDALRAVAAEMTLETLHEQRGVFARRVQEMVADGLGKNGLTIESVSITRLDQTAREFFNPDNAFDAAGLTKLTAEIEERRKRRNAIEQDSQVEIQMKNLEAEQRRLELGREEEYARLAQEREIAIRRAQQSAEVARETAGRKRDSEEAEIAAREAVERARLAADQAVAERRIALQQQVKEQEVASGRALEIAEVERRRAIELAEQQREIAIAEQARARAAALTKAEEARAGTVRAEEAVISARDLERAERNKALELVSANAEAERRAIAEIGAAEAGRKAALARAEAVRVLAEADAAADKLRAVAAELRYAIDAVGRRALNEADNLQSPEAMAMKVKLAAIEHMEGMIRESVRPLERIEGIKIIQVDGMGGGGNGSAENAGSLSDQVVQSALRFRSQAPLVDSLLKEIGLKPGIENFSPKGDG